jgi:hypothetical protein
MISLRTDIFACIAVQKDRLVAEPYGMFATCTGSDISAKEALASRTVGGSAHGRDRRVDNGRFRPSRGGAARIVAQVFSSHVN